MRSLRQAGCVSALVNAWIVAPMPCAQDVTFGCNRIRDVFLSGERVPSWVLVGPGFLELEVPSSLGGLGCGVPSLNKGRATLLPLVVTLASLGEAFLLGVVVGPGFIGLILGYWVLASGSLEVGGGLSISGFTLLFFSRGQPFPLEVRVDLCRSCM